MTLASWGSVLGPLGASWCLLGASWGVLEASWSGRLGFSVRGLHLGPLLGLSWGPLGPSWGGLGGFLGVLERRKGEKARKPNTFKNLMEINDFGLLGLRFGASWGLFRASRRILGASWGVLEASWSGRLGFSVRGLHLGPLLGPSWGLLGALLGAFWGSLGGLLGRLGVVLGASWASWSVGKAKRRGSHKPSNT